MTQSSNASTTPRQSQRREPKKLAVRTYREIARIIAQREGTPISPVRVKQMCRAAERSLASALRADPVFGEWLRPVPARVH